MITRDRFDALRDEYSDFSSWAVWAHEEASEPPKARVGDLTVLDPDRNPGLLDELNPDVVLLGLNASSRGAEMDPRPWGNFHDPSARAQDYKIRFALRETPYWGAYMTDVFIDLPETNSNKVRTWRSENPEAVAAHVLRLEQELDALGTDPLLVVFGDLAYTSLPQDFRRGRRVVKVDHYSNYIGKEDYRARILSQISAATT